MKVVIRETAAADLDGIFDWISQDSPRAAAELVRRIHARIKGSACRVFPISVDLGSSWEHENWSNHPTSLSIPSTMRLTRSQC
jgi:hypothetical protein